MNIALDANYWQNRYTNDDFPWDIGHSNSVLTDFVEFNISKDATILIPGAGSGYEVEALWNKGYTNIYALDYAEEAKVKFMSRVPRFPSEQYLTGDFFDMHQHFDVVLEQTFFCAIDPNKRPDYVNHMYNTLNEGGILYGVLFDITKKDGPPYGGNAEEYIHLFENKFEIKTLQKCLKSIAPRLGSELVIEFLKK